MVLLAGAVTETEPEPVDIGAATVTHTVPLQEVYTVVV